ncbi:hypothetical protein ZIOFF_056821 [Zingiber officinale]|uniref:Neprosin PEP catalytic domain-containing protein n=1 Tax=Zingiber officinale TaxID=94328 RepID=A0A8J5FMN2_ZINOF|nr:hypothetical protein ZIOFF_056821 [Zingiber officinale]
MPTETDSSRRGKASQLQKSSAMDSSYNLLICCFLLALLLVCPVASAAAAAAPAVNLTLHHWITAHLKRVNRPALKTIEAAPVVSFSVPLGVTVLELEITLFLSSCARRALMAMLLTAFLLISSPRSIIPSSEDRSPWYVSPNKIKKKKLFFWYIDSQLSQDPPERPRGHKWNISAVNGVSLQAWTISGESCPQGTVPIRRTTAGDILRASSLRRFGRKPAAARLRRDSTSNGHEHAVGYAMGDQYYGAKASLSVWEPRVTIGSEFSLSQIWVISGAFGDDLNTIEAGWQTDAYEETGCYNLLCSGFVQTDSRIAIGAAISPISASNGGQFDIDLLVWKDPKHGHWWLELGSGLLVGYWPAFLFSHLAEHANMVQFGGEIVNAQSSGFHTSTQMGSGQFAEEGFRRAAYFRNLQLVDWDNSLIPLANLRLLADHPNCYSIRGGMNRVWGNYFYYGGPGRNVRCP